MPGYDPLCVFCLTLPSRACADDGAALIVQLQDLEEVISGLLRTSKGLVALAWLLFRGFVMEVQFFPLTGRILFLLPHKAGVTRHRLQGPQGDAWVFREVMCKQSMRTVSEVGRFE
jgi:hypothetical protein